MWIGPTIKPLKSKLNNIKKHRRAIQYNNDKECRMIRSQIVQYRTIIKNLQKTYNIEQHSTCIVYKLTKVSQINIWQTTLTYKVARVL